MTRSPHQSGSAIILIFIAVAIFGALSFAVMRGGTGSMQTLTNEQARLAANEIIAYGDALAKTVQTLKLRGCADTQFDFANTVWQLANGTVVFSPTHNATRASDGSCAIFGVAGGVQARLATPAALRDVNPTGTSTGKGSMRAHILAMPGVGSSNEDLILFIPYINTQTCVKINTMLGVENVGDAPPRHTYASFNYNGTFPGGTSFTDIDGKVTGHSAFCAGQGAEQRFFRTLIAR